MSVVTAEGIICDSRGTDAAWRRLRNELSRNGVPKSNDEYKEMAEKVIYSYIINKGHNK